MANFPTLFTPGHFGTPMYRGPYCRKHARLIVNCVAFFPFLQHGWSAVTDSIATLQPVFPSIADSELTRLPIS